MVSKTYFISRAGQQHEPVSEEEFRTLLSLGHLKPDDLVWQETTNWVPAASYLDRGTMDTAAPSPIAAAVGAPLLAIDAEEQSPAARSWIRGATIFGGLIILVIIGVAIADPGSLPYRIAAGINGAIFGGIAGAAAAVLQYAIQKKLSAAPVGIAISFLGRRQKVRSILWEESFTTSVCGLQLRNSSCCRDWTRPPSFKHSSARIQGATHTFGLKSQSALPMGLALKTLKYTRKPMRPLFGEQMQRRHCRLHRRRSPPRWELWAS
jgi:hypothetical protein